VPRHYVKEAVGVFHGRFHECPVLTTTASQGREFERGRSGQNSYPERLPEALALFKSITSVLSRNSLIL